MSIYISNSPYSAGHLYTICDNNAKYIHNTGVYEAPRSARKFAVVLLAYMARPTHSVSYKKEFPFDELHFRSNRYSNFNTFVDPVMFTKYIRSLIMSKRQFVYNDVINFILSEKLDYEYERFLISRVNFFWEKEICDTNYLYKYSEKQDEMIKTMNVDDLDDEDFEADFTENGKKSKTAAKGTTAMTDQNKLFKFPTEDGKEVFCNYLATDSTGRWVMEVKGSGLVMSVAKDKVEEVVPFTISLRWFQNATSSQYAVEGDRDLLKKNMLITCEGMGIGVVNGLNTKSKTDMVLDLTKVQVVATTPLIAADSTKDAAKQKA